MTENSFYFDGRHCPYCTKKSEFVDSEVIYGRSYGMVYYCKDCDAYCGVHKGTDESLGRLANKELRKFKKDAHECFDRLWRAKMGKGFSKHEARSKAYQWLSKQMKIKQEHTHIGMFDVKECELVIEICNKIRL
jgi:hypothetical protein